MSIEIPASHRDLLERPIVVALATMLGSGQPHLNPMWCTVEGQQVLISTIEERQKARNLHRNRRATLLAIDPDNVYRWMEIRGMVEIDPEGGIDLINRLAKLYRGVDEYYGGVVPAERLATETRIVLRLTPAKIVVRG